MTNYTSIIMCKIIMMINRTEEIESYSKLCYKFEFCDKTINFVIKLYAIPGNFVFMTEAANSKVIDLPDGPPRFSFISSNKSQ